MNVKQTVRNFLVIAFILFITGTSTWAFSFRNMCLNVVQISDTHISDRGDTSYKLLSSSKKLLKDAIKTVNTLGGVDFVMFTGDMVDQPFVESYKDFFTILADLNYPSLMTFGNHDSVMCPADGNECPEGLTKEEALDIIKKCNRNYVFDKTYYAFTPKTDYRIVVLDPVISDEITSNGFMTDEQLEFLDNELSQNQDKVVVIFQHHPVIEPFVSEGHQIRNFDKYIDILSKYKNPILICSGHYHATKIFREKNLIFVSTPSLVTYPNAFRYIKITNYRDRTVFNFLFYETNLKETQEKAKLSTIAATSFYGVEKDRVQTITVKKPYVKIRKPKKEKMLNETYIENGEQNQNIEQDVRQDAGQEVQNQDVQEEAVQDEQQI